MSSSNLITPIDLTAADMVNDMRKIMALSKSRSPGLRRSSVTGRLGVAALLPIMLLSIPAEAVGQSNFGRAELTPYAGYRFGGSFDSEDGSASVRLDDRGSGGLILNVRETANTQWEVIYARQDTVADTSALAEFAPSTNVQMDFLQGGGTYEFEGTSVRPYLAATIGGTHISPEAPGLNSDTFWSMSIGLGLQFRPSERLGFRLEARAWGTLIDSDTDLFCVSDLGGAVCAIKVDGRVLWQIETFAGVVFRF